MSLYVLFAGRWHQHHQVRDRAVVDALKLLAEKLVMRGERTETHHRETVLVLCISERHGRDIDARRSQEGCGGRARRASCTSAMVKSRAPIQILIDANTRSCSMLSLLTSTVLFTSIGPPSGPEISPFTRSTLQPMIFAMLSSAARLSAHFTLLVTPIWKRSFPLPRTLPSPRTRRATRPHRHQVLARASACRPR